MQIEVLSEPTTWDEMEWGNLLLKIRDRKVIPVLGPDLMQVEIGSEDAKALGHGSGPMMLESYLTLRVAAEWQRSRREPQISPLDLPPDPRFNDLVCEFLDRKGPRDSIDNFYGYVAFQWNSIKLVYDPAEELPAGSVRVSGAIGSLAQITDFDLFVTTTGDQILERALALHRPNTPPFEPSPSFSKGRPTDLPTPQESGARPVVYHLFGHFSADAHSFVLTEDDLLDYVVSLQARDRSLVGLSDALRSNQLLVLGGGWHDWLARFFLRTVKPQLSSAKEVLADRVASGDLSLRQFLRRFGPNITVMNGGCEKFVATLFTKWNAQSGNRTIPPVALPSPVMPPRVAFISYATENRETARRLRQLLKDTGVEAWFDVEQLEAGDNWEQKIRLNIQRCTVFLPLISSATERRLEGFFRREWKQAVSRADGIDDKIPFVLPLLIDPQLNPQDVSNVPDSFTKSQWGRWGSDGSIPEPYLHRVRAAHQLWLSNIP